MRKKKDKIKVKRSRQGKIANRPGNCHICGKQSKWECEFCNQLVCFDCSTIVILALKPTGGKWYGRMCDICLNGMPAPFEPLGRIAKEKDLDAAIGEYAAECLKERQHGGK